MRIEDVAKAYAAVDTPRQLEQRMNNGAIGDFGISMALRLSKAAENGRGGWYDSTVISVDELRQQLDAQLLKPTVDYVDVANIAMMLHYRTMPSKGGE